MSGQPEVVKRLTREQAKARTRERLLESASRIFIAKGFAGASVEEIAESAGFSIGALYSNFDSKEQLFLELMSARRATRFAFVIEQFATTDSEIHPSLDQLPDLLLEVTESDQDFVALQSDFLRYANRDSELRRRVENQMRERSAALEGFIATALNKEGIVGATASDVTVAVMALTQGLIRRRRIESSRVSDELFVLALRWLFDGIRHGENAES